MTDKAAENLRPRTEAAERHLEHLAGALGANVALSDVMLAAILAIEAEAATLAAPAGLREALGDLLAAAESVFEYGQKFPTGAAYGGTVGLREHIERARAALEAAPRSPEPLDVDMGRDTTAARQQRMTTIPSHESAAARPSPGSMARTPEPSSMTSSPRGSTASGADGSATSRHSAIGGEAAYLPNLAASPETPEAAQRDARQRTEDEALAALGHKRLPDGRCEHRWANRTNRPVVCTFLDGWTAGRAFGSYLPGDSPETPEAAPAEPAGQGLDIERLARAYWNTPHYDNPDDFWRYVAAEYTRLASREETS